MDRLHNKIREFDIWKKTANLPTRASSIYGLAMYAKKCGLNPKVVIENKKYNFPDYRFYRYTKSDVEHASFSSNLHLKKAELENIAIEEKEITMQDIKKELKKGNLLILRLNTKPIRLSKKNTSNYVVVHGYNEKYFHVIDPAFAAISIPEETMKEAFESLETKKYRDHRMVIFQN